MGDNCYIKELQNEIRELKEVISKIYGKIYCIGGPLNDNTLNFNAQQRKWCHNIATYIKYYTCSEEESE